VPTDLTRPAWAPPRDPATRRADVVRLLETERHLWLASAAGDQPHLIPVAYAFDGRDLVVLTRRTTRTVKNLERSGGRTRIAVGTTRDVVMIDAQASVGRPEDEPAELLARLPLDPERVPGAVVLRLTPRRIQAWRGFAEMKDRLVMVDGEWR
jgi:hypothetical protein